MKHVGADVIMDLLAKNKLLVEFFFLRKRHRKADVTRDLKAFTFLLSESLREMPSFHVRRLSATID
jgi:hypothetical protein